MLLWVSGSNFSLAALCQSQTDLLGSEQRSSAHGLVPTGRWIICCLQQRVEMRLFCPRHHVSVPPLDILTLAPLGFHCFFGVIWIFYVEQPISLLDDWRVDLFESTPVASGQIERGSEDGVRHKHTYWAACSVSCSNPPVIVFTIYSNFKVNF